MIEQAIILAGSGNSQLGVLTRDRSRALLPLLGKPIIARVVERLYRVGVRRFVIILGEHEGQIASYLVQSGPPNAEIIFVVRSLGALGLAGAMAGAFAQLRPKESYLFTEADIITAPLFLEQLLSRFEQTASRMVVALCQSQFAQPDAFWPVRIRGENVTHVENHGKDLPSTQYGMFPVFACQPETAPYLTGRIVPFYGMRDIGRVLNAVITEGSAVRYALSDWYGRLTAPADVLTLNRHWLADEDQDAHILSELDPSVSIRGAVRIDPRVSIGKDAQIGPNVYLEAGSTVGPRAIVQDCVVLNGGYVLAGEVVRSRVVTRYASVS